MIISKNLSVLAYMNGFTLWHYKTEDTKETVESADYLNEVIDILNVGDLIIASVNIKNKVETVIYTVISTDGGKVKLSSFK